MSELSDFPVKIVAFEDVRVDYTDVGHQVWGENAHDYQHQRKGIGCSYLRADTCTPNEECVSKAELEKAIKEIVDEYQSQAGKNDFGDGVRTMGKWVEKVLREVMDK